MTAGLHMHCKDEWQFTLIERKKYVEALKFILELLLETFVYFKEIPANRYCSNLYKPQNGALATPPNKPRKTHESPFAMIQLLFI